MQQTLDTFRSEITWEAPYVDSFAVKRGAGDVFGSLIETEPLPVAKDAFASLVETYTAYTDVFAVRRGAGDMFASEIGWEVGYVDSFAVKRGAGDVFGSLVETYSPIEIKFVTAFDPAKRRTGARSLELFPTGKTDTEILTIPINNIQKGVDRTWTLDLWHARLQNYDRIDNVRVSAFSFVKTTTPDANKNALGKEVVDNGYLSARRGGVTPPASYTALAAGAVLNLGPMWSNDKITVDFKLSIPAGAMSSGRIMFGILVEWQKAVIYGDILYGEGQYGWLGGEKRVTVRLHGLPESNIVKDSFGALIETTDTWTKDAFGSAIGTCQ